MACSNHIRVCDNFNDQFQSYKINVINCGKALGFCVIYGITVSSPHY